MRMHAQTPHLCRPRTSNAVYKAAMRMQAGGAGSGAPRGRATRSCSSVGASGGGGRCRVLHQLVVVRIVLAISAPRSSHSRSPACPARSARRTCTGNTCFRSAQRQSTETATERTPAAHARILLPPEIWCLAPWSGDSMHACSCMRGACAHLRCKGMIRTAHVRRQVVLRSPGRCSSACSRRGVEAGGAPGQDEVADDHGREAAEADGEHARSVVVRGPSLAAEGAGEVGYLAGGHNSVAAAAQLLWSGSI